MGINLQGERYFLSLPRKAGPKQFKKMMASQLPNELKDYLISIEASLFRFEKDCIQNDRLILLAVLGDTSAIIQIY